LNRAQFFGAWNPDRSGGDTTAPFALQTRMAGPPASSCGCGAWRRTRDTDPGGRTGARQRIGMRHFTAGRMLIFTVKSRL
jgi:hypothetical protein